MATLGTIKRRAETLENMTIELYEKRIAKYRDFSPRQKHTRKGREFDDENRIIAEFIEALRHFNTIINQPFEEEE